MKRILLFVFLLNIVLQGRGQNYDESLVRGFQLPDPLKSIDSGMIQTPVNWASIRRPEIIRLFENNVYGQMPKAYDSLTYSITNQDGSAMMGKALLKEIDITIWRKQKPVIIHLVMFIPLQRTTAPPLFLLINNRGKENTDPARKTLSAFWPAELVIDSGYAVAAFHVSDLAPDNQEHYKEGVLQLYPDQLSRDNGMKAIGAWAWGASRVLDYLENDVSVDSRKVAVVGHSRGGKASLWAGATDQRFAYVFSNCSGNTGAALSRRRFGETIQRINTKFPYWFANNYTKYNDQEDSLPVDQHMLIAAIAPRPVYTTNATKDLWADPRGSFLALKHAESVYALLGKKSGLGTEMPPVGQPVIASPLGYHLREGEHDMTAFDWTQFVRFVKWHELMK